MTHIARNTASTAAAPLLSLWVSENGVVADPDDGSLTWSIYDVSTESKEFTPVLVTGPVVVDLDAHRIKDQTGHFAAVASPLVPAGASVGAHQVRWSWTAAGVAYAYVERFDVLEAIPYGLGGGYLLVSDFRGEDVCADVASTLRLLKLIQEKTAYVESVTGNFFEPRYLSVPVDGHGSETLLLGHPIIALASVSVLDQPVAIDFESEELRVYNRHLRGLLDPDDRVSPRVTIPTLKWPFETYGTWAGMFTTSAALRQSFPRSAQNVFVEGLFGYTDPDGTHLGKTPDMLRRATMLLVRRDIPKLSDPDLVFEVQEGHRQKRIRTRDQEIEWEKRREDGIPNLTGDVAVDRLLARYVRLIRAGSA